MHTPACPMQPGRVLVIAFRIGVFGRLSRSGSTAPGWEVMCMEAKPTPPSGGEGRVRKVVKQFLGWLTLQALAEAFRRLAEKL